MRRSLLSSLALPSLILFCGGCDMAARDLQAEQARRQQVAADLKAVGDAMHEKQGRASASPPVVTNASENAPASPPE